MTKILPLRLLMAIGILSGAGIAASIAPASAQNSEAEPPPAKWDKRCLKQEGSEVMRCEISYGRLFTRNEQTRWIASAGIQEISGRPEKTIFFFVPLGVRLQYGVAYRVDENEAARARFTICLARGCQAVADADENIIAAMKRGAQLQVQFQDATGQAQPGWITLQGFTAAYDGEPSEILTVEAPAQQQDGAEQPAAARSGKGDAPVQ